MCQHSPFNILLTEAHVSPIAAFGDGIAALSSFDAFSNLTPQQMWAANVRTVPFSYAYLWDIMDFLNDFFSRNQGNPILNNVTGFWVDVINNGVLY